MNPGQMHNWKLSKDIDGYVFFHTKDFYNNGYTSTTINEYSFFQSIHNPPVVYLQKKTTERISLLFKELVVEYENLEVLKFEKIHCLINLVYIELSRHYLPMIKINNQSYFIKLRVLENLINQNYKTEKYPYQYAAKN